MFGGHGAVGGHKISCISEWKLSSFMCIDHWYLNIRPYKTFKGNWKILCVTVVDTISRRKDTFLSIIQCMELYTSVRSRGSVLGNSIPKYICMLLCCAFSSHHCFIWQDLLRFASKKSTRWQWITRLLAAYRQPSVGSSRYNLSLWDKCPLCV